VKHIVKFIFCMAVLTSFNVQAMTGEELLTKCSNIQESNVKDKNSSKQTVSKILDAGSCAGFVGGVISGINLVGNMMLQKKIIEYNFVCLPKAVHSQQLLNIVLDDIEKDKKLAEVRAELAIFHIFNSKFSCAKK